MVSFPIGFPHLYERLDDSAPGVIDEIGWLTGDATGSLTDEVPPGAALFVRGWLLHVDGRRVPDFVMIRIDDQRSYQARSGLPRPDVSKSLGNADLERSGFEAVIPTGSLTPGVHEIVICSVDVGAKRFAEGGARSTFFLQAAHRGLPDSVPFGDTRCEATIDEVGDLTAARIFAIETDMVELPRGSTLHVRGWAYDRAAEKPASSVFALVDGHKAFRATYGVSRPDVAQSLGSDALSAVGFSVKIPTIEMDRGPHRLEIVALSTSDDRLLPSGAGVDFVIRERDRRPRDAGESTPAFLDSVVRVAHGRDREQITPLRAVRGDSFFLRGWAIDGETGTVGAGVLVVVDETTEILALYGLKRPDIAAAHGNPALERCGFTAEIQTDNLSPGRHSVRCYVIARDGRGTLATAQQFEFEVAEETFESLAMSSGKS